MTAEEFDLVVRGGTIVSPGHDPLRLAHLFGISDPTAMRYCADADGNGLGRPLPAESSALRQVR